MRSVRSGSIEGCEFLRAVRAVERQAEGFRSVQR